MFHVMNYNIFARSLGSNCIPWVLSINEVWRGRVSTILNGSLDTWIDTALSSEYRKHFHKNYHSGSKVGMRKLWSQHLKYPSDVSRDLSEVSFVSEHRVKYIYTNPSTGEKREEIATTLYGILSRDLPTIADELYEHIMERDEHFQWEYRGPMIFREIVQPNEEVGSSVDLVSLAEYDIHSGSAHYRGADTEETFPRAMQRSGYAGCLLNSPWDSDVSGIGLYWKDSVFQLADQPQHEVCDGSEEDEIETSEKVFTLQTGQSHRGAYNYDMHEHWHRLYTTDANTGPVSVYEEIPKKDRRNTGLVRLRHRESDRIILVVSTHLMTESRDGPSTNEYPGEVRAHEMATIGDLVKRHLAADVRGVLLVGDMNIDIRSRDLLRGCLRSVINGKKLKITTGFRDNIETPKLVYSSANGEREVELEEAFSNVHLWGDAVGTDKKCTSFTPHRCKWIDMIWYTPATMTVRSVSRMDTPSSYIPNENNGSDHLPLRAVFEFVN